MTEERHFKENFESNSKYKCLTPTAWSYPKSSISKETKTTKLVDFCHFGDQPQVDRG